jgi:tetratricopeptide (TPR) repeat protein
MTRAEAAKLVAAYGGQFAPTVNVRTAFLVVGREGWPLQSDGRLTSKLQKAHKLQRSGFTIEILQEDRFLGRLGLQSNSNGSRKLYTTSELTALLQIAGSRLRNWVDARLIRPIETVGGVAYFDYSQVIGAKTLCELAESGVTTAQIRRSLEQLKAWLPDIEEPLTQLALLEESGQLLVRVEDSLVEPTGQLLFDFDDSPGSATVTFQSEERSAAEWFEIGCEAEDAGTLQEAAAAYRQALLAGGPDRDTSFNLANVLYAMGRKAEAVERYYQVVELDRNCVYGWNNLGVVLAELQRADEAKAAFERAIEIDRDYADAYFNLADLLEDMGNEEAALGYWRTYLRLDHRSRWAAYANQRTNH